MGMPGVAIIPVGVPEMVCANTFNVWADLLFKESDCVVTFSGQRILPMGEREHDTCLAKWTAGQCREKQRMIIADQLLYDKYGLE